MSNSGFRARSQITNTSEKNVQMEMIDHTYGLTDLLLLNQRERNGLLLFFS